MSDQELDDLFKEASAKYEVPFDEKEWEKMSALLDKPSSPKPGFWNWKITSGLALLLLISGTVVVTQWDKISGDVGKNGNQTNVVIDHSKDPVKEVAATETEQTDKQGQGADVDNAIEISKEDNSRRDDKENESKLNSSQSSLTQSATSSKSHSSSAKKNSGIDNKMKLNSKEQKEKDKIVVTNVVGSKDDTKSKTSSDVNKPVRKEKQVVEASTDQIANDKENSAFISSVMATQQSNDEKPVVTQTKSLNDNKKKDAFGEKNRDEKPEVKPSKEIVSNNAVIGKDKELVPPLAGRNSIAIINAEQKENSTSVIATNKLPAEKNGDNNSTELLTANAFVRKTSQEKTSDSSVIVPPAKKDSVIIKEVITKEVVKKEEHKKIDSLTKIQRFSLKLALSPDFSSVGYYKPGKSGFNYGLLAEYNITRHWSITLGGIWSKKIYADTQTENLGYGAVNSTQIKGSCRVLDLPLNINYYITPQNAFSLYGSVGLSSYFMFDEDYTYDYVYGTKQYSYSKKIERGNTEWFRMMNLSIGIQQQLSPRVRLQLEPFIKAPLSGIGGGDLKLVSSGVFLNLKYTFK